MGERDLRGVDGGAVLAYEREGLECDVLEHLLGARLAQLELDGLAASARGHVKAALKDLHVAVGQAHAGGQAVAAARKRQRAHAVFKARAVELEGFVAQRARAGDGEIVLKTRHAPALEVARCRVGIACKAHVDRRLGSLDGHKGTCVVILRTVGSGVQARRHADGSADLHKEGV